nr:MFS transporter [Actinomycetota bacterium]
VVSGVGFFTDAYDLFVISTVAVLVQAQWNLSAATASWVSGSAILGAFVGALVFGRLADHFGRRRIYGIVAGVMITGAVAAAASPNVAWLIGARFVLGLGIGGDYPVSAVLMSEYSNRKDRGKLVGLVFSMQAVGLVVGPLVAMALLGSGLSHDLTWRLLLGLGAVPAASVVYLRTKMPESPRFQARVQGRKDDAARQLERFSGGTFALSGSAPPPAGNGDGAMRRWRFRDILRDRRTLRLLIGTAGAWFLFDYAYYGNSVSAPLIVKSVLGKQGAGVLTEALALQLILFSVAAIPGYFLAVHFMDRIGHRRLQWIGFLGMGTAFLLIGVIPNLTTLVVPFLLLFGVSYFFAEFGPNTTTFVLAAEMYPTRARATGNGISAGVAKVGAFLGVYLFPIIKSDFGVAGSLKLCFGMAVIGFALTLLIPEPSQRTLDDISPDEVIAVAEGVVRQHVPDTEPAA